MIVRGIDRRSFAVALAALALLARLLVPAGFMPARSAAGLPALILCTGSGPAMAMAGMPGMPGMEGMSRLAPHHGSLPDNEKADASAHACPFGALAGALDRPPPAPDAPLFALLAAPRAAIAAALAEHGRGLAAPPPPARGPPEAS